MASELERLREVMSELRLRCPWDARQTHESLLTHLVEETCEVVDAVETGDDAELCEELGDLLLQVYFHARIAEDEQRFSLEDVARGISDKLVRRHPHVFGSDAPTDSADAVRESEDDAWEARKRIEKGRTSVLQGIAQSMSSVARAQKVISRTRSHAVPLELADEPITADAVGAQSLELVARAQASGIDADAAIRAALRSLETRIDEAEQPF